MNTITQAQTRTNFAGGSRVVLIVRFTPKPDKKDAFLLSLSELVDRMRGEDSFIDAVISQDIDHPDELVMYETWLGSRESWLRDEYPRSYRAEYERVISDTVERRSVEWLMPLASWHPTLTRSRPALDWAAPIVAPFAGRCEADMISRLALEGGPKTAMARPSTST